MTPGTSDTDRLTSPWPQSAGLLSLGRTTAGLVSSLYSWCLGLRLGSSALRVSEHWLAEHARRPGQHDDSR